MNDEWKKIFDKVAHVLAVALFSAGLAFIQNILQQNGVKCGPTLEPVATGVMGSMIAYGKIVLQEGKNLI